MSSKRNGAGKKQPTKSTERKSGRPRIPTQQVNKDRRTGGSSSGSKGDKGSQGSRGSKKRP